LKNDYAKKGFPDVEAYVIWQVRLNRSKPMPLVDTTVHLSMQIIVGIRWKMRQTFIVTNNIVIIPYLLSVCFKSPMYECILFTTSKLVQLHQFFFKAE